MISDADSGGLRSRGLVPQAGWAPVFRRYGVLVALAALLIAMGIGSPSFLRLHNFFNILSQWTPVGIMAVGATYVILAGGFDLSAASGFALCAVVAAALATKGWPPEIDFLAALVVGVAIGAVNAFLVVGLKINPFIATLGSGFHTCQACLSSLSKILSSWSSSRDLTRLGQDLGTAFPIPGMVLIGFLAIGGIVLAKTPYGQWVYAVGGNPEASRLFGIRVGLVVATTYVFSGFCMGGAAAVSTSQLSYSASQQDPGSHLRCDCRCRGWRHLAEWRIRIDLANGRRTWHPCNSSKWAKSIGSKHCSLNTSSKASLSLERSA